LGHTGTLRERGIVDWNKIPLDDSSNTLESSEVYNLPFGISSCLSSFSWVRYVPFLPPNAPSSQDEAKVDSLATKQQPVKPEVIRSVAL
jgi:hypothetical protein